MDDHSRDISILKSRTYKPPNRREFVLREALIERLDANINLPLTLISAATGCGKSVTVSQWLDKGNYRYAWINLDDEHNEVNVFLAYIVSLMKSEWPHKTFGLESLINGTDVPAKLISTTLINDLDQLDNFFILVLDDYHLISNEKIHQTINTLLQYPPEGFHLLILTQRDPPLKLAKMRAQLRLHEIRMKDLLFSLDEARKLGANIGIKITAEQIELLVSQTDGWVTGITAGLMVLAEGVDFGKVIQTVNNQHSVISELLDEVVMSGMSLTTQKFLELTALPERFSTGLIDAMVSVIDDEDLSHVKSEEFISFSKRRNLFLIPLDSTGQWYRYHHFFRNQIKNRVGTQLTSDQVLILYKVVSTWFENEGLLEEALKYAILSKDMTYAVNLFDRTRNELFNSEQFQRLDRLIELFPEETKNSHLELVISMAMLQDHKANFSAMEKYLSRASLLLADYSKPGLNDRINKLKGEFHSVSTFLPYMLGNFDQCINESEKCFKLLPPGQHGYFREFAIAYHVFAKQAKGKVNESLRFLEENLEPLAVSDKYFRARSVFMETMVHGMEGDTKRMHRGALQLNALVKPKSFPGAWMAGIYYLATSAYMSNELEAVDRYHQELWRYRYLGRPFWVVHNLMVMGLASFSLGRWDEVKNYINECLKLSSELEIESLKGMVHAFEVEIALRSNDNERAIELSGIANFDPIPPIFYYYYPQLTRVKLYLETGKKEKGIQLLGELIAIGRKRNNVNLLIQSLILQSIIEADESEHEQAIRTLEEALLLSRDKHIIRPFLDFGDAMYQLLKELHKDRETDSQLKELLEAFSKEGNDHLKNNQVTFERKVYQGNMLTDRELEILTLVTRGYRNADIAEKLFVSLDTVKKHLYNAYQKLYVHNRTSAIKKIQELGLVDVE